MKGLSSKLQFLQLYMSEVGGMVRSLRCVLWRDTSLFPATQGPFVQKMDDAIHQINLIPVDKRWQNNGDFITLWVTLFTLWTTVAQCINGYW